MGAHPNADVPPARMREPALQPMTTPIVTEIAPSLEPVVRDPFIDAAGERTTPTNVRRPPAAARPEDS